MFGKLLGWLFGGGVTAVGDTVKNVTEVFRPNAEASAQRTHDETMAVTAQDMASLQQRIAEAANPGSGWFAGFVEALNRLPRPLITLGVLWWFVLPAIDPERFVIIAQGYSLVPEGMWAVLGVIVAFFFGGRLTLSKQQFDIKKSAVAAAHQIAQAHQALATARIVEAKALGAEETPQDRAYQAAASSGLGQGVNRVIEEWKRRHAAA